MHLQFLSLYISTICIHSVHSVPNYDCLLANPSHKSHETSERSLWPTNQKQKVGLYHCRRCHVTQMRRHASSLTNRRDNIELPISETNAHTLCIHKVCIYIISFNNHNATMVANRLCLCLKKHK